MEFGFGLSLIQITVCLQACVMLIFGDGFSQSGMAMSMSVASHDRSWLALIILSVNISYDSNTPVPSYVVLILRLKSACIRYSACHRCSALTINYVS